MARLNRLKKEIQALTTSPPTGISCWANGDNYDKLQAIIFGEDGSVYQNGTFKLEIEIPERYPFQPPKIRFVTKIYHPNIDDAGRICLDILKMPPSGSWRPAHNLSSILASIRLLMSAPNPDDPLMADIAEEFKSNKAQYEINAREWTENFASDQFEEFDHMLKKKTEDKNEDTKRQKT